MINLDVWIGLFLESIIINIMSPPTVEIAFGPAAELARTTPHAQEVKDKFAPLKAAEGLIKYVLA